ncbi:MAG TPA: hypothetical protein PK771_14045, partial [Spirochaetota bacterium]|nr:hypothetical protein [Spirochaetota bacterium]
MDNDKQIEKNPANLFLKEQVFDDKDKVNLYNLEDEFEKTKKNKHLFVRFIIFGFIVSLIFFAFIFSRLIENRNKKNKVSITAFEDVNLKDLLDNAKKNENRLSKSKNELQDLKNQLFQKTNDISSEASKMIEIISTESITDEEKKSKIAIVRRNERYKISNANIEYQEKIDLKNKEIKELQKIVDEYDQRQVEFAKKNEEVINNQQKLFDIEKNKMISDYESKIKTLNNKLYNEITKLKSHYNNMIANLKANHAKEIDELILKFNPILTDDQFQLAIQSDSSSDLVDVFELYKYDAVLNFENITTKKEFDRLRDYVYKRDTIMEKLLQVPYVNSIPVALYKSEFYNKRTVQIYESIWKKLLENVKDKNIEISNLNDQIKYKSYEMENLNNELTKTKEILTLKENIFKTFDDGIKSKNDLGIVIDAKNQKN